MKKSYDVDMHSDFNDQINDIVAQGYHPRETLCDDTKKDLIISYLRDLYFTTEISLEDIPVEGLLEVLQSASKDKTVVKTDLKVIKSYIFDALEDKYWDNIDARLEHIYRYAQDKSIMSVFLEGSEDRAINKYYIKTGDLKD